jgi:putative ABC transport system permease protein
VIAVLLWLVRRFPPAFQAQFGTDMAEQIRIEYSEARRRGRWHAVGYTLLTGFDLVGAVLAERMRPSFAESTDPDQGVTEMPGMTNGLTGDLRHAWRGLRRAPVFTIVAVGMLGIAIGVNAGIFSVVDTVLLRPFPFQHTDRLVYIAGTAPGTEMPDEFGVGAELAVQYRERSRSLEAVTLVNSFTSTLRVGDRVERVRMSSPLYNMFTTLGVRPILGRLPVAADRDGVAVISYQLWQTWFGGDPGVIGRSFEMAGDQRIVIGVMPKDFAFPVDGTLLWFPNAIDLATVTPGNFGWWMVGRVRPGVSDGSLANELTTLARQAPARFGGPVSYSRVMANYRAVVRPLTAQLLGAVKRPLWVLLGAVTIVLLIACANVANLFAVRTEGRMRELAVRRAIGAGRGELIRLQMAEALLVAMMAAVVAVVLARLALPVFVRVSPAGLPRIGEVHLDLVTVLYIAGAAVVGALACGLGPAVHGASVTFERLRQGGRGLTRRRPWVRDTLVVGQTALALVLLIGSGLLMRSFVKLAHVHPGYDTRDIFTFQMAPDRPSLHDGPTWAAFQLQFMDRLRALPGVRSVGLVDNVPLNEDPYPVRVRTDGAANGDATSLINVTFTAGDYFRTMGIAVLRGHPFTNVEATTPGRIVVSKTAADLLWPGQDPLGHRVLMEGDTSWMTVSGEVDDVLQDDYRGKPNPLIYLPLVGATPASWAVSSPAYVVKTPQAETIAPEVRALVHEVAPEAPMYRIFTMAGLARDSMAQLSFMMMTLGVASVLALILSVVGLYGVLSYVVSQRTREIGVRMALGAEAGPVRRMVVGQGIRVVGLGVVIGVVVAVVSTRSLNALLFDVAAIDVPTFAVMSAMLVAVGMLASYLPARRASSVDPIESLRGE